MVVIKGIPKRQTYKLPVEECVRTLTNVETHNKAKYVRDVYRAANTPSKISEKIVELLKTEFYIPECYDVKKPKRGKRCTGSSRTIRLSCQGISSSLASDFHFKSFSLNSFTPPV